MANLYVNLVVFAAFFCVLRRDFTVCSHYESVLQRVSLYNLYCGRQVPFHTSLSNSAGWLIKCVSRCSGSERRKSSSLNPQVTKAHGSPAFLAVSRSTSESPTYMAWSAVVPKSCMALSTASGLGLRRTVLLSPTAESMYP